MSEKELIDASEIEDFETREIVGNNVIMRGHLKLKANLIVRGGNITIEPDSKIEGTIQAYAKSYRDGGPSIGGDIEIQRNVRIFNAAGVVADFDINATSVAIEEAKIISKHGSIKIIGASKIKPGEGVASNEEVIELKAKGMITIANELNVSNASLKAEEICVPLAHFNQCKLQATVLDMNTGADCFILLGKEKSLKEPNFSAKHLIAGSLHIHRPVGTIEIVDGRKIDISYKGEKNSHIILFAESLATCKVEGIARVKFATAKKSTFTNCAKLIAADPDRITMVGKTTLVKGMQGFVNKSPDAFER